ncbi:MAG TPA: fibronectin type III domain-containing protein [Patescibacteria group bacterium]|nr:fibronectin type III domain-containing protein [Patescibacteria group bacterium]
MDESENRESGGKEMRRRIFVAIIVISFLSLTLIVKASKSDQPRNIHLTWQSDDTSRKITVTWESAGQDSGDEVKYDTITRGIPEAYGYRKTGVNHNLSGTSTYIHEVELRGLLSGTTYYFVCGGEGGWSQERAFTTAPTERTHIRIAAGGDSRTNHDNRDAVSLAMSEFSPSLVLMNGDLIEDGGKQDQWESFLGHLDAFWIGADGETIPIVPSLGNHERNATGYYEQFSLPGNEQWYSIDYGPDLHIIVLNSEDSARGIKVQREWLEQDLDEHSGYPWKIVTFHRNVFENHHEAWLTAFNEFVPLFDRYSVDMVINGHSHNYVRTLSINWTASQTTHQESYSEGTMYVVSGAWGAPLTTSEDYWWVAHRSSIDHFTLIDIYTNGTLHMQAKDNAGMTFDEAWITKDMPEFGAMMLERTLGYKEKAELFEELNTQLTDVANGFSSHIFTLEGQLVEAVSDLESLGDEVERMEEERDAIFSENAALNDEGAQLEAEISILKTQIEELQNRIDALERNDPYQPYVNALILGIGIVLVSLILARTRR